MNNLQQNISAQAAFLRGSTQNYLHRWRRDHIARLLDLYLSDIDFKKALVEKNSLTSEGSYHFSLAHALTISLSLSY